MAKTKTKDKTARPLSAEATEAKAIFGIVVEIFGTEIPISTEDLSNIKENGISFTLPQPVLIGSIDDLLGFLKEKFGIELPIEDLPDIIKEMVAAVTSLKFTMEQLAIDFPGTQSPTQDKKFLFRVAGSWDESKEIIPGVFALKGGVFGASNMNNDKQPDKAITISQI